MKMVENDKVVNEISVAFGELLNALNGKSIVASYIALSTLQRYYKENNAVIENIEAIDKDIDANYPAIKDALNKLITKAKKE
jgi:hypothetical protein